MSSGHLLGAQAEALLGWGLTPETKARRPLGRPAPSRPQRLAWP